MAVISAAGLSFLLAVTLAVCIYLGLGPRKRHRLTFITGFKYEKAPVGLDSFLVIDAECHKEITHQLSFTLTFTLIVSKGIRSPG